MLFLESLPIQEVPSYLHIGNYYVAQYLLILRTLKAIETGRESSHYSQAKVSE